MEVINIDYKKCTQCGICVEICPLKIYAKNSLVQPCLIDARKNMCIECGQCEAFCPTHAIQLNNVDIFIKNIINTNCDSTELGSYFVKRRSIRNYSTEPVDKNIIENILNITAYAPTAMNMQPVHWLIIHNSEKVKKIAKFTIDWMREVVKSDDRGYLKSYMLPLIKSYDKGKDPICRGAPHLLIAHAQANNPRAYTDCVIALTWFELLAPSFDLGACWAGFVKSASEYPQLVKELDLPDNHIFQHALMIGHPKYKIHNIPSRIKPRVIWK